MVRKNQYSKYLNFTLEEYHYYQFKKLQNFLKKIKKASPYYEKVLHQYKNIRNLDDFQELPVLEQKSLRENSLNEFQATTWKNIITLSSSSGTTGKSKLVLWDDKALKEELKWNSLGYLLLGVNSKSRLAMAMPLELSRCPSYVEACKTIGAFSIAFGRIRNDVEMDNLIDKLKILQITHIHASTSRILSITTRAKNRGYNLAREFNLRYLFGAGLYVSPTTRRYLEREWNAEFYDTYGANETSYIGGECKAHKGLHLLPGINYVEAVDSKSKKQISDSVTTGEILVTNYSNLGTPLLRYSIGDLGTIIYKKCECGLDFPRLIIKGRSAFTIQIGGTKLEAYEIDSVLGQFKYLTNNYQAVVNKKGNKSFVLFKIEVLDSSKITNVKKTMVKKKLEEASFECYLKVKEGELDISVEFLSIGQLERTDRDKIKNQVLYMEK